MNKRNTYCMFTEYNNNKSPRGFGARLANVMNVSVCGDDKRHENETWTQCTNAATKLWRSNKFVSCFVYQCVCSLFITLTRLKLWNLIWKPVRIGRAWAKCRRCKEMSEWEENADRHKNQTTQHAHRTSVFIFELLWCFHTPLHRFALRSMWTKKNLWQCKPNYSSFFFFSFRCDCTLRRLETLSFLHFCPLSSQMYKYTHTGTLICICNFYRALFSLFLYLSWRAIHFRASLAYNL